MRSNEEKKEIVRKKYGKLATENQKCCCCSCPDDDYRISSEGYEKLDGYVKEADLNLGCGIPTEIAGIKEGDIVLDLGSGAGNDVFIARNLVGETGYVIGVDITSEMLKRANDNLTKYGFKNVEFVYGDIEDLPFSDSKFTKIISNCVLNLVPDKNKAFSEMFRVIKKDGSFCVSDIVLVGDLPENIRQCAELYAGCISGASQKDEYLNIINQVGFKDVRIEKYHEIRIPESMQNKYLTKEEIEKHKTNNFGIFSITVTGRK